MNSRRSSSDDIAELRGNFGDDQLIEADPLRFRFFGQRPMQRTGQADQQFAAGGAIQDAARLVASGQVAVDGRLAPRTRGFFLATALRKS